LVDYLFEFFVIGLTDFQTGQYIAQGGKPVAYAASPLAFDLMVFKLH
jgi:hypothetical protein